MAVADLVNASLNSTVRTCANVTLELDSLHEHIASKVSLGVVYVLIFTTALFGNGLVIFVVIHNRNMQTVTNFFICNLAVSDIFVNITSLWLTPLYVYLARWVWGRVMCHMMPLTQGTSIFISSLTLTAIAIDRYIVILNPFKKRMTIRTCMTVIVSIWLLSLMLVAPYALHMNLVYDQDCGIFVCLEVWEYVQLQAAYGFVVLALQFGIPFLIITICYSRIWYHLNTRNTLVNLRSSAELRRKKRLLKMLILMVVIFALCWIPFNVLNLLRDLQPGSVDTKSYFIFLFILAHLISMSATGWNPILYAWMNENFRREFKFVLPCFRTMSKRASVFRSTVHDSEMRPNNEQTPLREVSHHMEDEKSEPLVRTYQPSRDLRYMRTSTESDKNSKFADVAESVGQILMNSGFEEQRGYDLAS